MVAQYLDMAFVLVALSWAVVTVVRAFGLGQKRRAPACAACPVRPAAQRQKLAQASANWAKK